MEAAIVERYWHPMPEAFEQASEQLVAAYPGRIERYEVCRNYVNDRVSGFRLGQGPRAVVFLGRVHGHEPAGTCGLLAFMDGLLGGKVPGTDQAYDRAARWLDEFTIDCIPMANPDAARRFGSQVPNSYLSDTFAYSEEDSHRYRLLHSEPGLTLKRGRPPHFTPAEMAEWRKTGRPIGSLFTEEGVELWRDWAHGRSPQIVALRELLRLREPALFVDIHQHEGTSCIFLPNGLKTGRDAERHTQVASVAYDALAAADLPHRREFVTYIRTRPDLDASTNWAYTRHGSLQYLVEIDCGYRWWSATRDLSRDTPPLSKAQIVMSVWHITTGLLSGLADQLRGTAP